MQKEMIFYFVMITMMSIVLKEIYRELRKDFLYPEKLMKTLIYKPIVRAVYVFVYIVIILFSAVYISDLPKSLTADFYLKYYKHNIMNKIMLCMYLIANYLIQTWKVKGIEDKKKNTDKKKRLSIELGIYSAVLLYLCISGKGNAVFNISVVLLFVVYNLENMFYIMPEKAEMMKTKETNTTKYVKNKELKPLKRMDAEKYKKEYLKKTRKSNRAYLLVYTGIVYAVILFILLTISKERFIAGALFYIICYFIGLFALLIRNKHKTRMAKEKKFENVYYGEGKMINTNEIVYLNEQGEDKMINAPDEMNKKNGTGDNVKIIIADGQLMELKKIEVKF